MINLRQATTGTVCALAMAAAYGACAAPEPPPADYRFVIGNLPALSLRDASDSLPNDGKIFGVVQGSLAVARVLKAHGAATDKIPLSINVLSVKDGNRVLVFDTGVPSAAKTLQLGLGAAGIKPGDVTDIFITHSHGDHVGGLVLDGQLAFPNAEIHISAPEWALMQSDEQNANLVKVIAARVRTFQPGQAVLPEVLSIDLSGHTPGQVGYLIKSGKDSLLDIGDIAHSSIVSLAEPAWPMGFDADRAKGAAARKFELAKLARTRQTVFAPHFPYPGVGRIVADGDSYRWRPKSP
jgi:glyoxylase-like metal-dependent hydrolase (beta-lactamase superfamily II)